MVGGELHVREALCARVIHELASRGELGELAPVADKPGLARALARTFQELRLAGLGADRLSPGLGAAIARLDAELQGRKLVDRAGVLRFAARAVLDGSRVSELVGVPLLLMWACTP